jgi:hypothetical protein
MISLMQMYETQQGQLSYEDFRCCTYLLGKYQLEMASQCEYLQKYHTIYKHRQYLFIGSWTVILISILSILMVLVSTDDDVPHGGNCLRSVFQSIFGWMGFTIPPTDADYQAVGGSGDYV